VRVSGSASSVSEVFAGKSTGNRGARLSYRQKKPSDSEAGPKDGEKLCGRTA